MDDLRWVLMLVGALVIAAVYFSSRFEREDWTREREQHHAKASLRKKSTVNANGQRTVKKEPSVNSDVEITAAEVSTARQEPMILESESPEPGWPEPEMPEMEKSNESSHEPVSAEKSPSKPLTEHLAEEQIEEQTEEQAKKRAYQQAVMTTDDSIPLLENTQKIKLQAKDNTAAERPQINITEPEQAQSAIPQLDNSTAVSSAVQEPVLASKTTPDLEASADIPAAELQVNEDALPQPEDVVVSDTDIKNNDYIDTRHNSHNSHNSDNSKPVNVESDSATTEIPATELLTEEAVSNAGILSEISNNHPSEMMTAEALEDEITVIDISLELEEAEAELKAEKMATELSGVVVIPLEPELDIEPLVLMISVMADDEPFAGTLIQDALQAEELVHGDMRIFHYLVSGNDESVFSVASLVEPGYFDPGTIDEMETPGLTLFCQLPGPLSGEDAFEIMLDKGRGLAVRLNGQMCDEKHSPFTSQAKTYYLEKIATYNREVELARKRAEV
ncbi:MAG: hypothetical protein COB30_018605 [Ectothiorhodospiraceae bacterium]|nr:hypothetical protein [Ectothiorhodospiraceae bacterium]